MKEENKFVIACLFLISIAGFVLAGINIYSGGPLEVTIPVVGIASNVTSGLIGYLTKGVVQPKKEKEENNVIQE